MRIRMSYVVVKKKERSFPAEKIAIFALTKAGSQWQVDKGVRLRPRSG